MNRTLAAAAALVAAPVLAQETPAPSPNEIVAEAPAREWVTIASDDLLVMTLAPDRDGKERHVVIQLMPPPFSQGWVDNIRTLARAGWYDGTSVNRVQDNYVVQWGDADGEDAAKAKPLPAGLKVMDDSAYTVPVTEVVTRRDARGMIDVHTINRLTFDRRPEPGDAYARSVAFAKGWPVGIGVAHRNSAASVAWPVHCYGMVGVGRGMSPDTGSGAELYTVIGHAPRHLDRNIALVGRVVEGIEHLSSLPRGTEALGFYATPVERVPIVSIRLAGDLPEAERPAFQYLDTGGKVFADYAEARVNRRDPFFIRPAGGADICNIPVPVRRAPAG